MNIKNSEKLLRFDPLKVTKSGPHGLVLPGWSSHAHAPGFLPPRLVLLGSSPWGWSSRARPPGFIPPELVLPGSFPRIYPPAVGPLGLIPPGLVLPGSSPRGWSSGMVLRARPPGLVPLDCSPRGWSFRARPPGFIPPGQVHLGLSPWDDTPWVGSHARSPWVSPSRLVTSGCSSWTDSHGLLLSVWATLCWFRCY